MSTALERLRKGNVPPRLYNIRVVSEPDLALLLAVVDSVRALLGAVAHDDNLQNDFVRQRIIIDARIAFSALTKNTGEK